MKIKKAKQILTVIVLLTLIVLPFLSANYISNTLLSKVLSKQDISFNLDLEPIDKGASKEYKLIYKDIKSFYNMIERLPKDLNLIKTKEIKEKLDNIKINSFDLTDEEVIKIKKDLKSFSKIEDKVYRYNDLKENLFFKAALILLSGFVLYFTFIFVLYKKVFIKLLN